MTIQLNGKPAELSAPISIAQFLKEKDLPCDAVAVEYNGEILSKEAFASSILQEGDVLEVLRFVGGG